MFSKLKDTTATILVVMVVVSGFILALTLPLMLL